MWKTTKPDLNRQILLKYKKGNKGEVITQGYLTDDAENNAKTYNTVEFWKGLGKGETYYDYADRQIQSLNAAKSKNTVVAWDELP